MKFKEPRNEHFQVLKDVFKIDAFKHEQWSVIRSIMYDKRDCCIIASTGFGKSLIYQFPPVFLKKLTVVISPLISLMEDQVISLKSRGIKACFFGSQQHDKSLKMADHNIVYITPEFFEWHQAELQEVRHRIVMFAIDEAHLIDQWSDFRKSFLSLKKIRENFPEIPIVALTATATADVKKTMVETLKLREGFLDIRTYLDRPNLEFTIKDPVHYSEGFMADIYPLLRNLEEGSAIVYVIARQTAENISESLNAAGLKTRYYHALMKQEEKKEVVADFKANRLRFVICTIAYGMGIDKGDVRLVLHYGVPKSLEAYYQEAGRAGRDGKPSKCIMFYSNEDFKTVQRLIRSNKLKDKEKENYMFYLVDKVKEFVGSSKCRRLEILTYLGTSEEEMKKIMIRSDCCDNCKRDLMGAGRIPPTLLFHGLDPQGHYDVSEHARVLLTAINGKLIRKEVLDMVMGVMPTKGNFRSFKLEIFGKSLGKPRKFWEYLITYIISNKFASYNVNFVKLEKDGKRFLRYKNDDLKMLPTNVVFECLERRDDIELFWKDGKVESRMKNVEGATQKISEKIPVSTENSATFSYKEEKFVTGTKTEELPGNLQAHSSKSFEDQTKNLKIKKEIVPASNEPSPENHEELDDNWVKIDWKVINEIEAENKKNVSAQDLKEQEEIEALNELDFQEDNDEGCNLSIHERKEIDEILSLDFDDSTQSSLKRYHETDESEKACSSKVLKVQNQV